ncbi:MAG: hypothetical protein PHI90_02985 [Clostridia bacterium]|nr:hypothetical protein [Clostridia bacterium]MDD4047781.1 hypothetical protein [Clostridia bacterium]
MQNPVYFGDRLQFKISLEKKYEKLAKYYELRNPYMINFNDFSTEADIKEFCNERGISVNEFKTEKCKWIIRKNRAMIDEYIKCKKEYGIKVTTYDNARLKYYKKELKEKVNIILANTRNKIDWRRVRCKLNNNKLLSVISTSTNTLYDSMKNRSISVTQYTEQRRIIKLLEKCNGDKGDMNNLNPKETERLRMYAQKYGNLDIKSNPQNLTRFVQMVINHIQNEFKNNGGVFTSRIFGRGGRHKAKQPKIHHIKNEK